MRFYQILKGTLLLGLMILFAFSGNCQFANYASQNSFQIMQFNNKKDIQSVLISKYGAFYPEIELKLKSLKYDKNGHLIYQKNYSERTRLWTNESHYLYNENQELEKKITNRVLENKKETSFYENDKLMRIEFMKGEEKVEIKSYEYRGYEIISKYTTPSGSDYFIQCRKLDDRGNEIAYDEISMASDSIEYKLSYNYKYEGDKIVEQIHYGKNEKKVSGSDIIEYDDNDRISKIYSTAGSADELLEFFYNAQGNISKINHRGGGTYGFKQDFEYTYKYDEKGNWIERFVRMNGMDNSVTKRIIKYY